MTRPPFAPTRRLLLAACALSLSTLAHAAFPDRVVTIVVPYTPGGAADALARVVAARLTVKLGSTVIIDNRAGASGTIGANYVARSAPDGYTVLYDATPYSINRHVFARMPFAADALRPVSLVSQTPNVLIVRKDAPFKDLADLIAQSKARPGKVTFASGGGGTVQRMAAELFRQKLDLDMVHVPYRSGGPAITDVVGGQVDFMFGTISATTPLVQSDKLRALAITSQKRAPTLPEVPTVAETVIPGFEVYEWNGLFVPSRTPDEVVTKLQSALAEVLREDEVKKRFSDLGALPVGSTPAQFADYLKKEDARWGDVVRKGNIQLD